MCEHFLSNGLNSEFTPDISSEYSQDRKDIGYLAIYEQHKTVNILDIRRVQRKQEKKNLFTVYLLAREHCNANNT